MATSNEIYQVSPGESVKVNLPHEIGYVEIRTDSVQPGTGNPVIGIEALLHSSRTAAADGHIYELKVGSSGSLLLIGSPGPKLLEQQRRDAWFKKVIRRHDSGDHSECPETCPTKEF